MDTKKPWQSKTLWVNFILAVAAFFPTVRTVIANNPDIAATVVAIVNMGLRLITKGAIELTDDAAAPK